MTVFSPLHALALLLVSCALVSASPARLPLTDGQQETPAFPPRLSGYYGWFSNRVTVGPPATSDFTLYHYKNGLDPLNEWHMAVLVNSGSNTTTHILVKVVLIAFAQPCPPKKSRSLAMRPMLRHGLGNMTRQAAVCNTCT